MAMLAEARQWFEQWIGAVATAVDGVAGRFMRRRSIELDENADGTFTARATAARDGSPSAPVSFRLDHDAHWLSDTVAGAALGVVAAKFVMQRRVRTEQHAEFSVRPMAGGTMLTYTVPLRR